MHIAIVGSRGYPRLDHVAAYVRGLPPGSTVVSGGARGVDESAARAAREAGLAVRVIPADWERHDRRAGPLRNTVIVASSDAVVAFWDGESRGTQDTIRKARAAGKLLFIARPDDFRPCDCVPTRNQ